MQKQQVFKVKGMQRDASMANANGEFAYEILNMRLMPAEDLSGFSLTNEKGTTQVITGIHGQVIGQCPTNDSLVVFITDATYNENNEREGGDDYIYEIYQDDEGNWTLNPLYTGNLNFHADKHIEALFNYETEDIQKVYWIDGINQLRCINLVGEIQTGNDQQFDSVKEINSLPSVEIERVVGGSFTAGVIQYYITYFNKNSSESPIVYTSPLLYIAHDNRGANVNDQVSTAFKLTFTDLDTTNWEYMRIYVTHRTSIDATPEASIVTELNMNNSIIEFTDYGSNRTSIAPTDLYFTGGKFVKAGTMTVKDQVMFLGNLNIETPETVSVTEIQQLFDSIRNNEDHPFTTTTRKTKENKLEEYEDTHYYYKNQLNNTESITHYKYGEKYRFGISVLDKYGNWSNPIWIKDAFIEVPPEQVDKDTLELPCPSLNLLYRLTYDGKTRTILEHLQDRGAVNIKPIVVFPKEDERKVIAQGVVCPTVYNLKDRKENGPYAQASWFMRPNAPVDLWNLTGQHTTWLSRDVPTNIIHESDVIYPNSKVGYNIFNKTSIASPYINSNKVTNWLDSRMSLVYDDLSITYLTDDLQNGIYSSGYDSVAGIKTSTGDHFTLFVPENKYDPESGYGYSINGSQDVFYTDSFDGIARDIVSSGCWLEFRHNYALRSKGWSWGPTADWYGWSFGEGDDNEWEHDNYPLRKKGYDISEYQVVTLVVGSSNATEPNGDYPRDTNGKTIALLAQTGKNTDRVIFYKFRLAGNRAAELDTSRFGLTIPVNRFVKESNIDTWRGIDIIKFNTGNSAYYVDNSIITLNSPEVECSDQIKDYNLIDTSFRVIGMIPITATISDVSLNMKGSIYNPSADTSTDFGLKKIKINNKNIGYHGYKGMVSANTVYSGHNSPFTIEYEYSESGNLKQLTDDPAYPDNYAAAFPLYPWQSTGAIPGFNASWEDKSLYSNLDKKILSNLRYSAGTYFFSKSLQQDRLTAIENENQVFIKDSDASFIGWKPFNGSVVSLWNNDSSGIIKLNLEGTSPIVYSANIDSIATMTAGENAVIPLTSYPYFYGRKLHPSKVILNEGYTPYIGGACFDDVTRTGIGASIKYKSSPHIVVGFNPIPVTIEDTDKLAQEILPSIAGCNTVGQRLTPRVGSLPISELSNLTLEQAGRVYENSEVISIPHQSQLKLASDSSLGLPIQDKPAISAQKLHPNYGWLWLGEIYRETDPTFGGTSDYALQNNQWENAGNSQITVNTLEIEPYYEIGLAGSKQSTWVLEGKAGGRIEYSSVLKGCRIDINNPTQTGGFEGIKVVSNSSVSSDSDPFGITGVEYNFCIIKNSTLYNRILIYLNQLQNRPNSTLEISFAENILSSGIIAFEDKPLIVYEQADTTGGTPISKMTQLILTGTNNNGTVKCSMSIICSETAINISYTVHDIIDTTDNPLTFSGTATTPEILRWTSGDTYYQRFDTLKTYAYSDSDQNSVIDITSFMVETRINIDGRTDRNRGQESNLQMSPTNFNLMNDVYSQRDNFFTYRILDEDLQARTNFPNQITWSLTKTAGATVDAWMNITLASVLDLDGTKGKISALKNFNNNIIAFQEKGLSHIMFNSRAQIATSEAVPIQIANTGKVDGQQYFTTDVGCQDKWNIVTTPNGLYFVDYFNKSIYRFNGQLEDISTPNGFRSWCYENLNSTANIIGYYDVKNKEVMYYIGDTRFKLDNDLKPTWLGFSELTGAFSSFYTYPKAWFANVQDQGLWIVSEDNTNVYTHQTGNYNELLNTDKSFYGLTVIPRQDSNTIKTFNNVEFRADSYNGSTLDNNNTFDTISAETEYQTRTSNPLTYSQYRPSNLKKKFRTWRANIPRVNNGYNRFVNQWAKIGLWKMNPGTEKTILHDLSVWYSE